MISWSTVSARDIGMQKDSGEDLLWISGYRRALSKSPNAFSNSEIGLRRFREVVKRSVMTRLCDCLCPLAEVSVSLRIVPSMDRLTVQVN